MNIFSTAKWIWANNSLKSDDYAEFVGEFNSSKEEVVFKIASDSVYALYINDSLVKFMTCSDFPFDKYVDVFSVSTNKGKNNYKIQVWHYGVNSSCYIADSHGLIFEIFDGDNILDYSSKSTKSRVMNEFRNGYNKVMVPQLGLSFHYDNTVLKGGYFDSIELEKPCKYSLRDINNIVLLDRSESTRLNLDNYEIYDLHKETAGFFGLDIDSSIEQEIIVSYGEHINDGCVRRIIGDRDFSVSFTLKKGENKIFNPLRRVAGRYLQIEYTHPIKVNYLGIRPVRYEQNIISKNFNDPLLNEIYKVCLSTLELCMHEHYEDCPWREQCLYILDSRNQMLCGYYAFEGYSYQRHNLLLIAKSFNKELGVFSLTAPCGSNDYPIPFFSLVFIKQVEEYINHTKDYSILEELGDVLHLLVNKFSSLIDENHLIKYMKKPFWNFYEWTDGNNNDGDIAGGLEKDQYELILNSAYVYFIESYKRLYSVDINLDEIKNAIKKHFYDEENSVYYINTKEKKQSQLANAFVCLIGLGNTKTFESLLNPKGIVEASLSTRGFVYDALLTKGDIYHEHIIDDIKKRYSSMLKMGATSFFEVEEGAEAFRGAASLCHGWSALPVYYLNIIKK